MQEEDPLQSWSDCQQEVLDWRELLCHAQPGGGDSSESALPPFRSPNLELFSSSLVTQHNAQQPECAEPSRTS